MKETFGFIGGGRIVRIFLEAMQRKNVVTSSILVSDPDDSAINVLTETYPDMNIQIGSNLDAAQQDWVFLAVHPPVLKSVLPEISESIHSATALISLAPVFKVSTISKELNGYNNVVRMIPNASTFTNKGYNPVYFSQAFDQAEKEKLVQYFSFFGEAPEVTESHLEAYAILTAMGPTYLWPQLLELHSLGLEFGLDEIDLIKGMRAMVTGTVDLLYNAGLEPDQVVDLIPVKPLGDQEEWRRSCRETLTELHNKLTGK